MTNTKISEARIAAAQERIDAYHPQPEELAEQPGAQEPVAVVGSNFNLLWAGSGPIAPIVERHGLKRGSLLYAAPPAPGIDLGQLQRYDLDEGFDHYRGLPKDKGAHLHEYATGEWVKWDDVQSLISSHNN